MCAATSRNNITDYNEEFWIQFEDDIRDIDTSVDKVFKYFFERPLFNVQVQISESPELRIIFVYDYDPDLVKKISEKATKIITQHFETELAIRSQVWDPFFNPSDF